MLWNTCYHSRQVALSRDMHVVENNKVEHMKRSEKQTAKVTKKAVKKRFLTHAHFFDVVENLSQVKQNTFQSVNLISTRKGTFLMMEFIH